MKVLVTGGSGFIGSHVVEKLIEKGIKVLIYDLMFPEFLEDLPSNKKKLIDYYQGSLLEEDRVRLAAASVDAILHLAAVADVNDVVKEPRYAENLNVRGTFNILEAVRVSGKIKRVIYASSIWVYQDTVCEGILTEETPLSLPSHFYTATKLAGEAYCMSYSKLFNIPTTVLRFGIPYGPRARETTVIALFVEKALRGEPLTIAGDGSQHRKFVYIEDLAEGCVLALKDIAKNKMYNLEGDEKVSIKQIAETIETLIGGVEIKYIEGRKGDFSGKEISNEKAKKELGWALRTSFRQGINKYIQWYQENRKKIQEENVLGNLS